MIYFMTMSLLQAHMSNMLGILHFMLVFNYVGLLPVMQPQHL